MLHESLQGTIRTRVKDVLNEAESGILIIWENSSTRAPERLHAEVHLLTGETSQRSFGVPDSRRFRKVGVVQITLKQPFGTGTKAIEELASKVEQTMGAVTLNGVTYRAVTVRPGFRDGGFWTVIVEVPFYSDRLG